jgi:hypothetical protein
MEPAALLAELRALAEHAPDFASLTAQSPIHYGWLGKVHALVSRWNESEGESVSIQTRFIGIPISRASSVGVILSILYRAIADLELQVSAQPDRAFGPGAVYDVFKVLRDLLMSAAQSILLIDPYLDEEIFDAYLTAISPGVAVRLLTRKSTAALRPAMEKFIAQSKMRIEVRCSGAIHDRVVFLDDRSCWVLGQSIKDAAKSKPTYLAPLSDDTAQLKMAAYEQIWVAAIPI